MPRTPRKQPISQGEPVFYLRIFSWIRKNPINSLIILLVIIALLLYLTVIIKTPAKEIVLDHPLQVNIPPPANSLEIQIEKQNVLIKKLEEHNLILENNIKVLDKKIQTNTEIIKRMCEYIWVITIDKKIAPRQCYPDYNWRREDTNGN